MVSKVGCPPKLPESQNSSNLAWGFSQRSGGGRRSSGGARSLLSAFEPGIPCHCDRRARERRSRARRIHDARAIFAESGPQREADFSADVQRRARKQAQRRRCRAAWAGRVQWRGAAGSDVHRVAPRGRRSARAGQEALGRLQRTSALIAGRDSTLYSAHASLPV